MKVSFIQLIKFLVDNARVFQQVYMDINITVGQAACRLWCRHTQSTLAASCLWWIVSIVTCESGERACGWSCFIYTDYQYPTIKTLLLVLSLSNKVLLLAFLLLKARLAFLDVNFSILIFFKVNQKSHCYWELVQVCTATILSKSEKVLMSLN